MSGFRLKIIVHFPNQQVMLKIVVHLPSQQVMLKIVVHLPNQYNTIQYNTTLLSLCREISFLARHLNKNIQYS